MRTHFVIALFAACASAPLAAQAPAPAAVQHALPGNAAANVVRDVIGVVRKDYVFPDRADAIVKRLETGLASGRYATANPAELSERMSTDLRESSGNDGHMYINFNPEEASALARPRAEGGPDLAFFREQMTAANHGIAELRILPGNVRYMNISQWFWDPASSPRVYDDAMRFLRDGDAIVVDISGNGGGSAEAVNYLVSHFMEPDRKLMTFRAGPSEVEETRTQRIAAGRITGKPLVVLIGPRSASASEEFASHIKHFRLGTLVGRTTAGAGNPNTLFPVAHGFVVSVSTGTAVHPVTNKGWEGEGVAPDWAVEPSKAIDLAHLEALRAALATASPQRRPSLEWMIAALTNDAGSAPVTAAQLRSFAGSYEGERLVTERSGRLYWQRGKGPEFELIPLGGNRFALGDRFGTRIEFEAAGLQIFRPATAAERVARVAS